MDVAYQDFSVTIIIHKKSAANIAHPLIHRKRGDISFVDRHANGGQIKTATKSFRKQKCLSGKTSARRSEDRQMPRIISLVLYGIYFIYAVWAAPNKRRERHP